MNYRSRVNRAVERAEKLAGKSGRDAELRARADAEFTAMGAMLYGDPDMTPGEVRTLEYERIMSIRRELPGDDESLANP